MLNIFKKKDLPSENLIEINLDKPVDCIADFTYNFYWNHKGEKLNPDEKIPRNDYTYKEIVEHLKNKGSLKINGDVGHRLASSMGVDLQYFGGTGKTIEVGDIFIDGNISSRMGISMTKGNIYVKGKVTTPIGNLLEVKSDVKGYKKFKSITEIIINKNNKDKNNTNDKLINANITSKKLEINDNKVRDTVGARLDNVDEDFEIILNSDVDLSTGILMKKGVVIVNGNAGNNTAALLNGGTIIIDGNCNDFTAVEMKKGIAIINGNAGKYLGAKKIAGTIYAKEGSPIHPTKKHELSQEDKQFLQKHKFNPNGFFKYK